MIFNDLRSIERWLIIPNPPTGYTKLNYIENANSNKAYLDTGIYPTATTWFEIEYSLTAIGSNLDTTNCIFGTANTGNGRPGYILFVYSANGSIGFRLCTSGDTVFWRQAAAYDTNRHIIKFENNKIYIDNDAGTSITPELTSTLGNTLGLFIRHLASSWILSSLPKQMRCYYFHLWNDNGDVAWFVPAMRNSDSKIGMYDMVSNSFKSSVGTNEFTYG